MRFVSPENGTIRIVRRFAIFPIVCRNETRWLQMVTFKQRFEITWYDSEWTNVEFID